MAQLTPVIDQVASFTTCVYMQGGPKAEFGNPDKQATDANGVPKWEVVCSVAEPPTFAGRRPNVEPLIVTITTVDDPTVGLTAGQPVLFNMLRVGATQPEAREDNRGQTKAFGGKFYYSALGVRAVAGSKS